MGTQNKLSSKTLWFNALVAVAGLAINSGLVGHLPVSPGTQLAIVGAGNFILRFFTTQPLAGVPTMPVATDAPPSVTGA